MRLRCYEVTPSFASELDFLDTTLRFTDHHRARLAARRYSCGFFTECDVDVDGYKVASRKTVIYSPLRNTVKPNPQTWKSKRWRNPSG